MSTTFSQMQTLLDQWGDAVAKRDLTRIMMLRKTIDSKLSELFKLAAGGLPSTVPASQLKRPPPPPPRPMFPPRQSQVHLKPPPLGCSVLPPRKISCTTCAGTGIIESGNAFLRCRSCDAKGYTLSDIEVDDAP